jgi:SNF2 family DNA or RNA helicase
MTTTTKYTLNGNLYAPYQVDGVKWMTAMEHQVQGPKGGFLCDEMGLGKTIQIIATILGNPQKKTLIVVPKTIVTQWAKEIEKFAPGLRVLVYDGPQRTKDKKELSAYDVVVCPYSVTYSKVSILNKIVWDRIVLDEAHEIRNKNTRTFKCINALESSIRWLVTGTPIFNSIEDFVTLCDFLGICKNVVLAKRKEVKDIYIMRRTKTDSSLDLPYCHFENLELDMYTEERVLYDRAFNECCESISHMMRTSLSVEVRNMHILECLLRVRQLMIWPQLYFDGIAKKDDQPVYPWPHKTNKMETLFKNIRSHPDEKAIIFCHFKGEMDNIEKYLDCTVFRIDGTVDKNERHRRIELFTQSPCDSVMITQIKCGGQGLNIQCATRVYIMSPSWNPSTELQAIGRCHRSGQTNEVHVKKLVYNDTQVSRSVDLAMMSLQGHKSVLCAEVLNDKRLETQIPMKQEKSIDVIRNIFR